jgi:hypothetical protein
VSRRRRGGEGAGEFPSPWAETPQELGCLAEALLWAEPKCTVHFLNYRLISFDLIQINSEFD